MYLDLRLKTGKCYIKGLYNFLWLAINMRRENNLLLNLIYGYGNNITFGTHKLKNIDYIAVG